MKKQIIFSNIADHDKAIFIDNLTFFYCEEDKKLAYVFDFVHGNMCNATSPIIQLDEQTYTFFFETSEDGEDVVIEIDGSNVAKVEISK